MCRSKARHARSYAPFANREPQALSQACQRNVSLLCEHYVDNSTYIFVFFYVQRPRRVHCHWAVLPV